MFKYRNKPTGKHASKKEARRSQELNLLVRCGSIADLREQVRYEIIPKQEGERAAHYIADFVYRVGEETVVEDAKGFGTPAYVLKRKLMLKVHGIHIQEI